MNEMSNSVFREKDIFKYCLPDLKISMAKVRSHDTSKIYSQCFTRLYLHKSTPKNYNTVSEIRTICQKVMSHRLLNGLITFSAFMSEKKQAE